MKYFKELDIYNIKLYKIKYLNIILLKVYSNLDNTEC